MFTIKERIFLAKNIKYFRKIKGLSQVELSDKLGYTEMTIRRYESGSTSPSIETLFEMANLFGCSVENLIRHDFESGSPIGPSVRTPIATKGDFYFFLNQKYNIYYLSEKKPDAIKSGKLEFDKEYDKERLFLHGQLKMHHLYDCKLVIEHEDSALVYCTGIKKHQRVFIALHFPDFGQGQIDNPAIRYRGGVGIVVHKDTYGNQTAQRICLSYKKLNTSSETTRKHLIDFLTRENEQERICVGPQIDSEFCQWILGITP